MQYCADKLVYIDFNNVIFADLYIGKDDKTGKYRNDCYNVL